MADQAGTVVHSTTYIYAVQLLVSILIWSLANNLGNDWIGLVCEYVWLGFGWAEVNRIQFLLTLWRWYGPETQRRSAGSIFIIRVQNRFARVTESYTSENTLPFCHFYSPRNQGGSFLRPLLPPFLFRTQKLQLLKKAFIEKCEKLQLFPI